MSELTSNRFVINESLSVPLAELDFAAIRAQGCGGQNVNKVSSAIHLRFDIGASSLPEYVRQRLLVMRDSRITRDGVVVIKSQTARTQEKNRALAMERLRDMVLKASHRPKVRRPTKPSKASKLRRLQNKTRRSKLKATRRSSPVE